MDAQLPQRPASHQLETASKLFFRKCLPRAWTCDEPQNDYGADFRVGITEENLVTGKSFVVQLKASDHEPPGKVSIMLKVSTLNYLRSLLEVAVLVKYIASEEEAYWLLLREVPQPPHGQKEISVRIPRQNRLSADAWKQIKDYVTMVHYKKLGAMHQTNGPVA